jgi:hypothetical protein
MCAAIIELLHAYRQTNMAKLAGAFLRMPPRNAYKYPFSLLVPAPQRATRLPA